MMTLTLSPSINPQNQLTQFLARPRAVAERHHRKYKKRNAHTDRTRIPVTFQELTCEGEGEHVIGFSLLRIPSVNVPGELIQDYNQCNEALRGVLPRIECLEVLLTLPEESRETRRDQRVSRLPRLLFTSGYW